MRREPFEQEFLQKIAAAVAPMLIPAFSKVREAPSGFFGRVIRVRDATGRQAPKDVGIVRLPASVVALADH